jgi:hypothetical protein
MKEQQAVVRQTNGVKEIGTAGLDHKEISPVHITSMPVWQLLMIRVVRIYLHAFLGLLTLDGLGVIKATGALEDWTVIGRAIVLALAPSFVALCHNALEYLTRLDVKNPQWRA